MITKKAFPHVVITNVPKVHMMKQWCLDNVGERYDHLNRIGTWDSRVMPTDSDGYENPHKRVWFFTEEQHLSMFTLRWV